MDTKLLKQKILDLAIRGKLVPQDPNDEPASVLLERIRAEREQLIKQGKLKRSKSTSDNQHYQNVPFEIPASWEWTTIGELLINRDSERIPLSSAVREKQTNKIYPYYGAAGIIDMVDQFLFSERLLLIGEDGANLLSKSKDNAFFAEGQYWVNNHAHVLDCSNKLILDFVAFVINASTLDEYITGSAQPKLSQDNLNKIRIPLPPLEEQRRIIETKQKWFKLIDELNANKAELQEATRLTKAKVLNLAIHGKLVPQDPNDEPASELLKRISPHAVPCDTSHYENLPFEVPQNWAWVQLGMVAKVIHGRNQSAVANPNGKYPIYGSGGIMGYADDYLCPEHCTIIGRKGTINNPILVETKFWNVDTAFGICPSECIDYLYLYYFCKSFNFTKLDKSTTLPSLTKTCIEQIYIPLPPLAEQMRIVAKVRQLLNLLDKITAEL